MATPEEFAARMRKIAGPPSQRHGETVYAQIDEEAAHGDADRLLCDTLRALGYGDGVEVFERMDKWYA